MAERRGSGLAARLKAAIGRAEEQRRRELEARRRRAERAREARARLLADLADFGRAVGHFDVAASPGEVSLRYGEGMLRFVAEGDADRVAVRGDGLEGECALAWRDEFGEAGRWVLRQVVDGRALPERLLFDEGLEFLVRTALDVPADPESGERP